MAEFIILLTILIGFILISIILNKVMHENEDEIKK
jgi:hypothetical protein